MMRVWRAMSHKEYENWKANGIYGLFHKDGKMKRMVWFATDKNYISSILLRDMYNNRRPEDAYNVVVEFEFVPNNEVNVKLKEEVGYVNIGIHNREIGNFNLKEVSKSPINELQKTFDPVKMVYWTTKGRKVLISSPKELKRYLRYGNLRRNPWFIRADMLEKFGGWMNDRDRVERD